MSLAVCLLVYAVAVMVLGPPLLGWVTRTGAAPRLGIAVWITAMGSVLGAWAVAVGLLGEQLLRGWGHLDATFGGCVADLSTLVAGGRGWAVQAGIAAAGALTAAGIAVVAVRVVLALGRSRAHTSRHAEAALLAARGTPRGPDGALIVDAPHRSVYCLPGRTGTGTIVITRAAMQVLDEPQLAAVMAHERAHLSGRHHQLLAFTTAMARILPGVRLFTEAATQIARLAELSADDAAARRHGGDTVVDALLALAVPTRSSTSPTLVPGLGAATSGVADRVERLLFPPSRARARLAQTAAVVALLLGPATLLALVLTQAPMCAAGLL